MASKIISALVASSVLFLNQAGAQSAAGASGATQSALGGLTEQQAVLAVAGFAVLAAVVSGSGGSSSVAVPADQAAATAAASSANAAASYASEAVKSLEALVVASIDSPAASVERRALEGAITNAKEAQAVAKSAADDLALASSVKVDGLVNSKGSEICRAANTCTKAELANLSFKAANAAKNAAEAVLGAVTAANEYKLALVRARVPLPPGFESALDSASTSSIEAQNQANAAIKSYEDTLKALGTTGTTIAASTGTTGTTGTR